MTNYLLQALVYQINFGNKQEIFLMNKNDYKIFKMALRRFCIDAFNAFLHLVCWEISI